MNKPLFLILLFVSSSGTISAQDYFPLTKEGKFKYKYGERVDKLHNMQEVFQHDPQSMVYFDGYLKARKAQKINGVIGGSIFTLSTLWLPLSINKCKRSNSHSLCELGGVLTWATINIGNAFYILLANLAAGKKKREYSEDLYFHFNKNSIGIDPFSAIVEEKAEAPTDLLSYSFETDLWIKGAASGKFYEIAPSLAFDGKSLELFNDYEGHRKRESRRFRTAGALGGVVLTMAIVNQTLVSEDTAKAAGHIRLTQIYPGVAALLSGGLGLLSSKSKVNSQGDLIRYYNNSQASIVMASPPHLELIINPNGLGVAYVF